MALYGHRQLSIFFRPLVETSDTGFCFKGKQYGWNDVSDLSVWEPDVAFRSLLGYPAAIPRAKIFLKDGKKIRINGRVLEKKGRKPRVGFSSCKSDAFDELVALFKAHAVRLGAAAE